MEVPATRAAAAGSHRIRILQTSKHMHTPHGHLQKYTVMN